MPKPITHVATTDIHEMLNSGSERRMDLPGFDAEFVDFPHYIVRFTERIWHERQIELCKRYYAHDCVVHTMAGDNIGAETVIANTRATLDAFPDRRLDADNVIWSDEGDGTFYSSHLITSKMTNKGASEFGPSTGKKARVQTIAECLCKDNRVIEEWLVRDNLNLVKQLGFDATTIARAQAQSDLDSGQSLIDFHATNRAEIIAGNQPSALPGSASAIATLALRAVFLSRDADAINALYDYRADMTCPGGASLYGPDQIIDWHAPLWSALSDVSLSIDHIAEIPYLGHARDVSIRWSLTAHHSGDGRYGRATGAPVYILGVNQFRIMHDRVREEICLWDDVALHRQIETARLSQ